MQIAAERSSHDRNTVGQHPAGRPAIRSFVLYQLIGSSRSRSDRRRPMGALPAAARRSRALLTAPQRIQPYIHISLVDRLSAEENGYQPGWIVLHVAPTDEPAVEENDCRLT